MDRAHRRARAGVALMTCGLLFAPMGMAGAQQGTSERDDTTPALTTPFLLVHDRGVEDRLPQPEDRYALTRGCYTIEVPSERWVARGPDGIVLAPGAEVAEPFHFQPLRLGQYLLATNEGPDDSHDDAWWDERGYLAAAGLLPELPLPDLGLPLPGDGLFDTFPWPELPTTDDLAIASEPGAAAEWQVVAAANDPDARDEAGQAYRLSLPDGRALAVRDGALTLVDGDGDDVRFHLADGCAVWPEVGTNTSGAPAPVIAPEKRKGGNTDGRRRGGPPAGTPAGPPAGTPGGPPAGTPGNPGGPDRPAPSPAAPVQGFFESHVHGMAYEFLGGELRCGQPWHPYGVEYALPDCRRDGQALNPVLEVVLADADPSGYDPVGWPTFETWPAHDLLTHEQWYWKWVERSYHGGMRLLTNLLVDNTALCQLYPQKRNSCNEMDSVRLQADRMFELQDYIDAQYGGPGEGWFRIVTSPAQAREAINAGRLAVVLGIEVSNLLDCNDLAGEPTCTTEEIDERLQEVFDMGVRQMEIINKFDNGLSGVTGDGGATGIIVNQGNKYVTGHYWDMRTCPPEADLGHDGHHGHGHADEGDPVHLPGAQRDKHQMNLSEDAGLGEAGEVDVLVGQILNEYGDVTSYAAPVYPAGPHCNELGLTDMGRHAITRMLDMGIIFDPDHMSARGMREALDMIEHEYIPREIEAAEAEDRAPILPGLISSHSWGNDVIYQRIYQLGGTVGPRTGNAHTFAGYWHQRREWFDELAPDGLVFGMGYGADTNGFGAQPGPRGGEPEPVEYTKEGFQAPIGDVTIYQQKSGVKTYDINTDGVAHYGLFADWFHEVALAADQRYGPGHGDEIIQDMLNAAENYIQMWERATYGGNDCVVDHSTLQVEDVHALLGLNLEGFLRSIGAPVSRDGAAYTYCATSSDGVVEVLDVVFDADGRANRVSPNPGTVTPSDTSQFPGHDHDHAHALGAPLPATGAGLAAIGLFLLGLAVLGGHLLRGARRTVDQLPS